jgi:hypothetical protein
MPRQTRAALRLITEAQGLRHSAKAEPHGDPDGFGVHRTVKFDKNTTKWLADAVLAMRDSRIQEAPVTEAGYLHVTFVADPRADHRDPFYLAERLEIAAATKGDGGSRGGQAQDPPAE